MEKINIVAGLFTAFNFEEITVGSTVKTFTDAEIKDSEGRFAKKAFCTVESANLRYKYNGNEPTSSSGHLVYKGDIFSIIGSTNIRNFKAIRTGTTDSKLSVTYER